MIPHGLTAARAHLASSIGEFAFGELSQSGETRRAILEKLLPQLKIASRCTLEGIAEDKG